MADFTCKFLFRVLKRCSFQVKVLFLLILCIIEILGKFGSKLWNDTLELKMFLYEYTKDFWYILKKFIVYKVSLLPGQSNKKHFQLVDLAIGRL